MSSGKCTLVPSQFFDGNCAGDYLAAVVGKDGRRADVAYREIPEYGAFLVYGCDSQDEAPRMYEILKKLPQLKDYNKILCAFENGVLSLGIAQGGSLLLSNEFDAPDFTTAQYYIFLCLSQLQLNPEVSTICFLTDLDREQKLSLFQYFKDVEICG